MLSMWMKPDCVASSQSCSTKRVPEPFGIRSVSRCHESSHTFCIPTAGASGRLPPAESNMACSAATRTGAAIWMPINALLVRALINYYGYFGNDSRWSVQRDRAPHELVSGRRGNNAQAFKHFLAMIRQRPFMAARRNFRTTSLARQHPVLRILPRRQRRRSGCWPSDRWTGIIAALMSVFGS